MKQIIVLFIVTIMASAGWARLPADPNDIGNEDHPQAISTIKAAMDEIKPFGANKNNKNRQLVRLKAKNQTAFKAGSKTGPKSSSHDDNNSTEQ